jgi:hypothetical protein
VRTEPWVRTPLRAAGRPGRRRRGRTPGSTAGSRGGDGTVRRRPPTIRRGSGSGDGAARRRLRGPPQRRQHAPHRMRLGHCPEDPGARRHSADRREARSRTPGGARGPSSAASLTASPRPRSRRQATWDNRRAPSGAAGPARRGTRATAGAAGAPAVERDARPAGHCLHRRGGRCARGDRSGCRLPRLGHGPAGRAVTSKRITTSSATSTTPATDSGFIP